MAAFQVGKYHAGIGLKSRNTESLNEGRKYLEMCENNVQENNNEVLLLLRDLYLELRDLEAYERVNRLLNQ